MSELSLKSRVLLFFYSTKNVVGCVLALLALGLFFGGLIRDYWLAIVVGAYVCGYLAVPRNQAVELAEQSEALRSDLLERLDDLIGQVRRRLPQEALARLVAIREALAGLMPKMQAMHDSGALSIEQTVSVTRAITHDLPGTLANFLKLPPAFAAYHVIEQGKTAKQLVVEQLSLLQTNLEKIAESASRDDAEALVLNGRFLREKFHAYEFVH